MRRVDNQCECDGGGGAGTSGVNVFYNNVGIPNNPHITLNFTGAGVNVIDAGAGIATINIPGAIGSSKATYTLLNVKTSVTPTSFATGTVAVFPWSVAKYGSYTNGTLVFRCILVNRNMSIRLQDTTNNVTLATTTVLSPNTITIVLPLSTIPGTDATIELQVMKSSPGGTNPQIFGCELEFDT